MTESIKQPAASDLSASAGSKLRASYDQAKDNRADWARIGWVALRKIQDAETLEDAQIRLLHAAAVVSLTNLVDMMVCLAAYRATKLDYFWNG